MKYTEKEIKKYIGLPIKDLVDNGICPTCFDRQTNHSVFGDDKNLKVYEDDEIECLFVANPRADGHMIITTKEHFHDLSECSDEINEKIIVTAKRLMLIIKEVFGCERVYLCTMSDGPMNHYHMQLIPRYSFEERGSKNFVKPRKEYVFDEEKFNAVKAKIKNSLKK